MYRIFEVLKLPESSYQPFNRLDCRHKPQAAPGQPQESINLSIQLLILGGRELGAVLALTLLPKDGRLKAHKTVIELAKLLEAWEARRIQGLVTLGGGDSAIPNQRLGVGGSLGFEVEG